MFKFIIIKILRIYQKIFSFDSGWLSYFKNSSVCRYYPRCSEYAIQAVEKHGVWRGLWLGMKRISRCHPGRPGGFDPVPEAIFKEQNRKDK